MIHASEIVKEIRAALETEARVDRPWADRVWSLSHRRLAGVLAWWTRGCNELEVYCAPTGANRCPRAHRNPSNAGHPRRQEHGWFDG